METNKHFNTNKTQRLGVPKAVTRKTETKVFTVAPEIIFLKLSLLYEKIAFSVNLDKNNLYTDLYLVLVNLGDI